MLWHRQAIFESKGDKLSSSAECRIWTWKSQDTYSPADWMPTHKLTELLRIKLKTWTQQPVPMMSEHSAPFTSLPFGFRTWLWRYTCLLLLISMLWSRQAIFEYRHTYIHTCIFVGLILLLLQRETPSRPAQWIQTWFPSRVHTPTRSLCLSTECFIVKQILDLRLYLRLFKCDVYILMHL